MAKHKVVKPVVLGSATLLLLIGLAAVLPYVGSHYPIHLAVVFVSLAITAVLSAMPVIYVALKTDRLSQKQYLHLWKQTHSLSLSERQNAARDISKLSEPHLRRETQIANLIGKTLISIWGIIVITVSVLIVIQEM